MGFRSYYRFHRIVNILWIHVVFSSGVKLMEHYAWHQHVNFAYYEGIKDGSTARARKPATGWLTDYISYYEKGYADGAAERKQIAEVS